MESETISPEVARTGDRAALVIVAAAGALPTILWAVWGGGLLLDDWNLAAIGEFEGIPGFVFNMMHRPIGKLYDGVAYTYFGTTAWPYLVLLATWNALVAVLLWRVALDHLPRRYAVVLVVLWLTLPNRSASRFWIDAAPNVLALAIVLAAVHVGFGSRRWRHASVVVPALLLASVLTYHGIVALSGAVLVVFAWRETSKPRDRLLAVGGSLGAIALLVLFSFEGSGRSDTVEPFATLDRVVAVHLGSGILPEGVSVIGTLLLLLPVWSVAAYLLPGFEARLEERMILLGTAVVVLGTAPFLLGGFPLTVSGINDRANIYADVGTALLLTGAVGLVWRSSVPALAPTLAAGLALVFGLQTAATVTSYRDSVEDGQALRDEIRSLADEIDFTEPLALEPLPNHQGVSFIHADAELRGFLALTLPGRSEPDDYRNADLRGDGSDDTGRDLIVLQLDDGILIVER